METRSSPSMRELRAVAADRGLKYYLHLSKPELFSLLQRKEGGGGKTMAAVATTTAATASADQSKQSSARPGEPAKEAAADRSSAVVADAKATRVSERLCCKKTKRKASDEGSSPENKKKAKVIANTLDPIMLTELGPHTVRRFTRLCFRRPSAHMNRVLFWCTVCVRAPERVGRALQRGLARAVHPRDGGLLGAADADPVLGRRPAPHRR